MKRLLPLEKLIVQILVTYLLLMVLFLVTYWDLMIAKNVLSKTLTFTSGLLLMTVISTGFTLFRTVGCKVDKQGITHIWQRMNWSSVIEVGYIRDRLGRMKLYIHSQRAALQVPMRTVVLYGDDLLKFVPEEFHDKVAWGLEQKAFARIISAGLTRKAQIWTFGITLFSLLVGKTVWYLPYFYTALWTSVSLLIPLLWLLSLLFLVHLYPKLLSENFPRIVVFLGYMFGAIYLWYGIVFRMNLYY